MSELLGLDNFALSGEGPTLSMSIPQGAIVGVFGPSNSGKSEFLKLLSGGDKPAQGKVNVRCEVSVAEPSRLLRRSKPLSMARSGRSPESASRATEALLATHLWEARSKPIALLTIGQQAAAELLKPLTSDAKLLLIDGQLDLLDPWALRSVTLHLRKLRSRGISSVIVSNKLDLLGHVDLVLLFDNRITRFAGSCEDLKRLQGNHQFQVSAKDQPGALALVAPFAIAVEARKDELCFRAHEGQSVAARLLLEGYGNVSMVVDRPPSVEECLLSLIR